MYCNVCNKYKKFKNPKILNIKKKHQIFKCGHEYQKIFEKEESIEILEIIGLITNIEEYQKMYNYV